MEILDYQLPKSWQIVPFKDACSFSTKPRNLKLGDKIPFFPMDVIPENEIFVNEVKIYKEKIGSGTFLNSGDVVLAKITPSFENGKQAIINIKETFAYATTEVIPFNEIENISDKLFLFYVLKHPNVRANLAGQMEGSTGRQRLSKEILGKYLIPLPPIAEQKKIAAVLSLVQEAISQQEKAIALTTELKKALMQKLFTEGTRNEPQKMTAIGLIPESWEVVTFKDTVNITNGQVDPTEEPYSEMLHVGSENIESNSGKFLKIKTNKELKISSGNYYFDSNDILYSKIRPYLNKVAIPDFEGTCSADMYPIQSKKDCFEKEYLFQFLLSSLFLKQAISFQDRTGIPKINRAQLGSTLLLKAPLDEQKKIAFRLGLLDKKLDVIYGRKKILSELFQTLLHQLMTAQIRVDDLDLSALNLEP